MNIIIIGASRGIGAAIAQSFARRGYNLFLCSRNGIELEKLSAKIRLDNNVECYYCTADVTNYESIVEAAKRCISTIGKPNFVIYNSGISKRDSFKEINLQDFRDVFEVNYFGLINSIKVFLPLFSKDIGGVFAAVSSLADARGMPGNASYTSSKAAVSNMLEAARVQLLQSNIKIITIKPGFVKTEMTQNSKYPMPFLLEANVAGERIVQKLIKGKMIISFPLPYSLLSWIAKLLPRFFYDFIFKFKM